MMKLSINKSKTFLPLSMSKGTTEQRLQKARLLNLRFYDNLKDEFVDREVKPSVFKRVLKDTAGAKLGVEMFASQNPNTTSVTPLLGAKSKIRGYAFYIPQMYWTGNIRQSHELSFLKDTQRFFNDICNPKFLARKIALINKSKDTQAVQEFYSQNVAEKQVLKEENLDKLLKDKNSSEKIDILQYLRYTLLGDKNTHQAEYKIDKHIEKAENLRFPNKNYDLSDYNYDEKMMILNQKLAKVIQDARKN